VNLYEKTLAQIEKRDPKLYYRATFKGLTPKGVRAVDRFLVVDDPEYKRANSANKQNLFLNLKHHQREEAISFDHIFYYDDPAETEQDRLEIVKNHALEAMKRNSITDKLEYKKDYEVSVRRLDYEV
jgi:hypothetical protein